MRKVLNKSDFFSIFNQRRGGFNEIIFYFYFSFTTSITLSRMKWNIQEMIRFFKTWCLEGLTPHKKDGSPLCDLPPSYNNFNRPTSLLPQVHLNWQASYKVFFYPHYILNFFTSLFTWPRDQRHSPPQPWRIKKSLWKCTFSRIITHN